MIAILKSAILDQSQILPKGKGSCSTLKKTRIVTEIDRSSLMCIIYCGSEVINTESSKLHCSSQVTEEGMKKAFEPYEILEIWLWWLISETILIWFDMLHHPFPGGNSCTWSNMATFKMAAISQTHVKKINPFPNTFYGIQIFNFPSRFWNKRVYWYFWLNLYNRINVALANWR